MRPKIINFVFPLYFLAMSGARAQANVCLELYQKSLKREVYQLSENKNLYHWFLHRPENYDEQTAIKNLKAYGEKKMVETDQSDGNGIYAATDPAISCDYGVNRQSTPPDASRWRVAQIRVPKGAVFVNREISYKKIEDLIGLLTTHSCLNKKFQSYIDQGFPQDSFFDKNRLSLEEIFSESSLGISFGDANKSVLKNYPSPSFFNEWGAYTPPAVTKKLKLPPSDKSAEIVVNPKWIDSATSRIFSKELLLGEKSNPDAINIHRYLSLALSDKNFIELKTCRLVLANALLTPSQEDVVALSEWTKSNLVGPQGLTHFLKPFVSVADENNVENLHYK